MVVLSAKSAGNASGGETCRAVRLAALERGLITWECGTNSDVIGLMPPLISSRSDVDEACGKLREALSAVETGLGRNSSKR